MARIFEIDFLKGIAVILMIVFHFFFLSNFMNLSNFNIQSGILYYIAKIAQMLFITLVGINLYLSKQNSIKKKKEDNKKLFYKKQLLRSVYLLISGIIISFITYKIFGPEIYIKFGILHFIAISIIVSLPIVNSVGLILMALCFVYLLIFSKTIFYELCQSNRLSCFIMGIKNIGYSSLDHFNFIDYYPYILLGLLIGNLFYSNLKSIFYIPKKIEKNIFIESVTFAGKYSYIFYLSHFVILYLYFKFLGGTPKKFIY